MKMTVEDWMREHPNEWWTVWEMNKHVHAVDLEKHDYDPMLNLRNVELGAHRLFKEGKVRRRSRFYQWEYLYPPPER